MSRGLGQEEVAGVGFPRVSGDEPRFPEARDPATWFSPRERG